METETTTPQESEQPQTGQEFLATLNGAPTQAQLDSWKKEVPNGALRGFSPDGKRCYILRGITGQEMRNIQGVIPESLGPEAGEAEFKLNAVSLACMWTSTTRSGKLEPNVLRSGTAGLPDTLFAIVENLSDYFAPVQIMNLSFEL